MDRWDFLSADEHADEEITKVMDRLEEYATKAPVELHGQPILGRKKPEDFKKVSTMARGLIRRDVGTTESRRLWKKITTFITLSFTPDQDIEVDNISKVISQTPVAYDDLPVALRGEKTLKGKFTMDLAILKQPQAPGDCLVIKIFTNMGGSWSSADVADYLQEDERAYSFAYFGKNFKYSAPVAWCARKFMQEAGGLQWILTPIQETPAEGQQAHDEGVSKIRNEVDYILRESKKHRKAVELDIWVRSESAATNPQSNSKVRHYKPTEIYSIIGKDKTDDKKAEASSIWAHTLLDIQPAAVRSVVEIIKNMPKISPFGVGLAGWGKSFLMNVLLSADSRYEKGNHVPEVFTIKDWDEVRNMTFCRSTPIFFDDGVLANASPSLMKDIFGEHAVQACRKIRVRFEFVFLQPDCLVAGANNPFDRDLAKETSPEDMTVETLLKIIRPTFGSMDEEDYAAICRRCSFFAVVPTTELREVVYVSVPESPTERNLSHFFLPAQTKHLLIPECKGAQEEAIAYGGWCPPSHWENCNKEWQIMHYLRTGVMDEQIKQNLPSHWVSALFPTDNVWSMDLFQGPGHGLASLSADLRGQVQQMDEELFVKGQRVQELLEEKRKLEQDVESLKRQKRCLEQDKYKVEVGDDHDSDEEGLHADMPDKDEAKTDEAVEEVVGELEALLNGEMQEENHEEDVIPDEMEEVTEDQGENDVVSNVGHPRDCRCPLCE